MYNKSAELAKDNIKQLKFSKSTENSVIQGQNNSNLEEDRHEYSSVNSVIVGSTKDFNKSEVQSHAE